MPVESIEETASKVRRSHDNSLAILFLALMDEDKRPDGHQVSCTPGDADILNPYLRLYGVHLEQGRGTHILRRHKNAA